VAGRQALLNFLSYWWDRRCGARQVLQIAIPLVVSTMSYSVMQFCDRLFLAWHDTNDLAAVVPAGVLSWTILSLPMGTAMYATTFVAQYLGAKQRQRIGAVVWQAVWIGVGCVPVFILIGSLGEWIFTAVRHSPELIWRESAYFWILSFGSGASVINAALASFWTGRGQTATVMYVNMFAAAINIGLDYALIFGFSLPTGLVVPEMGIAGAALATSISLWCTSLVFLTLFLGRDHRAEFGTSKNRNVEFSLLGRLLRFGIPNGFQFFVEGAAITVFVLIIAQISDLASAATALAFSVNMFVFIPVLGLSFAITALVGQQIGESKPALAVRATWTGLWIGLAYTFVFACLYVLVPDLFLTLHQAGAADFEEVRELAAYLLAFVAVYCVFDTVQVIFVGAIKGAGDTMFVVWFTILSSACFLLAGFWTSTWLDDPTFKVRCWWFCLTVWIMALSVAYLLRFLYGRWKTMQVIEPDLMGRSATISEAGQPV
jgi:MATE family multidrug resistance protein